MEARNFSLATLVATVGGLGFLTRAPGTLGSAVAVVFYLICPVPWWGILAAGALGAWAANLCARERGADDPGFIIVDEVVGMWASLYAIPLAFTLPAFFLFRIVDIVKPFPVSSAEKLPGGLGIMADDVVGGVICNVILQAINWIFWGQGWLRALFV